MELDSYPLLKSGGFNWVLLLAGRSNNLGDQPMAGHHNHRTSDVGRRFPEIYDVWRRLLAYIGLSVRRTQR
ncbi:hypothetical protein AB0F91_41910 [Amycolatopsis sp. NPDC023774]|uniref:hypothetical protein n=1 Tax=Amycolatopsis sp. NPDC023774 TaxID=3155015 RepID=UPI0033DCE494